MTNVDEQKKHFILYMKDLLNKHDRCITGKERNQNVYDTYSYIYENKMILYFFYEQQNSKEREFVHLVKSRAEKFCNQLETGFQAFKKKELLNLLRKVIQYIDSLNHNFENCY